MMLVRRQLLAAIAASVAAPRAHAAEQVRLGVLQFGTVQWVSEVIRTHRLDVAHGFALITSPLANTDAGRITLMAGANDIVVSDWMFVAAQRAAGTKLCFSPFSASLGGIMVPADSLIAGFGDLPGKKLGVAGGPVDKSWLLVQAACRKQTSIDLRSAAQIVYGAPPLLSAKLHQGELDAVLTFWNFAAELQVSGAREIIAVADCAKAFELPADLSLVGFVFRQDWADAHGDAIYGFLRAVADADHILATTPSVWDSIRPVMNAPTDALFSMLRQRFIAGIPIMAAAQEEEAARRLFAILHDTGGAQATAGLKALPRGTFWTGA